MKGATMTLQDLIDELSALPESARTATVFVRVYDVMDEHVGSVRYEGGEVIIEHEGDRSIE